MAVTLVIEDGNPWYLSPNVWTVPGSDPVGPPGMPVAGQPCYLWAHVQNTGTDPVSGATARFYWANPALGFDRTTANLVGSAFVTLGPGASADVLCLTPWVPVYVNQGHECILAEASHATLDPLPAAPAFNVPTDRHVAQRNLSVLSASSFSFAFEVHNPGRKRREFVITARNGDLGQVEKLLARLGKGVKRVPKPGRMAKMGFVKSPCPDADAESSGPRLEGVTLEAHERAGYALVGDLQGGAALIHVVQEADGHEVGGLALLLLPSKEERS